jgi:DNA-binding HxlR family transcriptional regulator
MFENLDKILNQQVRLAIVSILTQVESAEFKYLQKVTKTTQGNLSHQLKSLNDAGYITIKKSFENNYPKTTCMITEKGLEAFQEYVETMKQYLHLENNLEKVKEQK